MIAVVKSFGIDWLAPFEWSWLKVIKFRLPQQVLQPQNTSYWTWWLSVDYNMRTVSSFILCYNVFVRKGEQPFGMHSKNRLLKTAWEQKYLFILSRIHLGHTRKIEWLPFCQNALKCSETYLMVYINWPNRLPEINIKYGYNIIPYYKGSDYRLSLWHSGDFSSLSRIPSPID